MARLENLLYKDKPYFEERWPDETKKWNMKTPWEQFRAVAKYMLLLFVVGIFILFLIEGDSSMLSVCLQSDWKGGFNLHSITVILLMIGWLFTAKVVIHKVLYLLARVSGPRGETICNMIDSYSDYILVLIGFFVSLNQLLGVSAAELSLTSGIIGIILGIGCESIVADMLAGILMAFDGAVHVGDVVFFEGERNYVISIGVRTTKLKLNGKTTVVRNNDFKNYVTVPAKGKISESAYFRVNLSESIERVEEIIDREMPVIHDRMAPRWKDLEGPFYWGVNDVSDSWIAFCIYIDIDGAHYTQAIAQLKAELKMMCDRNHIQLAMRQIVVHEENTEK